jgi:YtkA-like protein
MFRRSTFVLAACASQLGCSSEAVSADASTSTSTSTSGLLTVSARTLDDQPPTRGANPFDIEVVRAEDGAAVEGLALTLTPWMPAMGHGTSVRPVVSDVGAGHYLAENVYLFMPGLWELRLELDGPLRDDAAPSFQIR